MHEKCFQEHGLASNVDPAVSMEGEFEFWIPSQRNEDEKFETNKIEDNLHDKLYEMKNLCVECGIDMGYCNPRQYCGKTYCMYSKYN